MDLTAHAIRFFCKAGVESSESTGCIKLSPIEIERIYSLSNYLMENPQSSLNSNKLVARRFVMNIRKINTGFRALFGMTMHGFIKQSKLKKARLMPGSGEFSVKAIA